MIQNIITFLRLGEWNSISILQSSVDMCTRGSLHSPRVPHSNISLSNGALQDSGGMYWCTTNIKRNIYSSIDCPFSSTPFIKSINTLTQSYSLSVSLPHTSIHTCSQLPTVYIQLWSTRYWRVVERCPGPTACQKFSTLINKTLKSILSLLSSSFFQTWVF